MINRGDLSTQWSPVFYHPERLKYLDIFLDEKYQFEVDKLKYLINISSEKSTASQVDRYLGMANIASNTGSYIESENEKGKGDCSVFHKGNVLFGKLRPYLNKVYLAEFDGGCTTEFIVMNSLNEDVISNRFLSIFLLLDCVVNQTKYMMTGNTLPRLQTFDIENFILPVPQLTVQQKIIDIMDNAYKLKKQKEQEAKDLLDGIDNYLLDKLGIKLPDEPENSIENRTFKVGFDEVFNSRFDSLYFSKYFQDIVDSLDNGTYEVVKLLEISKYIFQGIGQSLTNEDNNILLKVKNVLQNNEIDFENIENITDIPKVKVLQEGDILTPFIGEAIKKYKFSVFHRPDEDKDYCVDNNTGVIRLDTTRANADYVASFFISKLGKQIVRRLIGGGGVPFLGANNAKKLILPLPDIDIQNEIAIEINKRREEAKQLQNEAKEELKKAKKEVESIILGDNNGKS